MNFATDKAVLVHTHQVKLEYRCTRSLRYRSVPLQHLHNTKQRSKGVLATLQPDEDDRGEMNPCFGHWDYMKLYGLKKSLSLSTATSSWAAFNILAQVSSSAACNVRQTQHCIRPSAGCSQKANLDRTVMKGLTQNYRVKAAEE